MSLWETFTLAVKNISGSKMRTFLTMLGIIIGVCAVIVIVAWATVWPDIWRTASRRWGPTP